MVKLELSREERETALETLKSALSNLRYEIADTDSFDYRQGLKARRAVLARVVEALESAADG